MERVPNAVYTKEFREEAVMMVTEADLPYRRLPEDYRFPNLPYRIGCGQNGKALFLR